MAPRVDGSKVRLFATKRAAQRAARSIGWPVYCAWAVETRFVRAWALNAGIVPDPRTGDGYVSREWFGELFRARNGDAVPDF